MRTISSLIAVLISVGSIYAEPPIDSRTAKIDNVDLHYLTAGHGPALILLHGKQALNNEITFRKISGKEPETAKCRINASNENVFDRIFGRTSP
jgi:hypothetical protein